MIKSKQNKVDINELVFDSSTIEEVINLLSTNHDKLPIKVLTYIIQKKEKSIPILINKINNYSENLDNINRNDMLLIFALMLLGQFECKESFKYICNLLFKMNNDKYEYLFDSFGIEYMPRIICAVYTHNDENSTKLMNLIDLHSNEHIISLIIDFIVIAVQNNIMPIDFAKNIYKKILEKIKSNYLNDIFMCSIFIDSVAILKLTEFIDDIKYLHAQCNDNFFIAPISEIIKMVNGEINVNHDANYVIDIIKELSQWHLYKKYEQKTKKSKGQVNKYQVPLYIKKKQKR